jgi:hypothetical protein
VLDIAGAVTDVLERLAFGGVAACSDVRDLNPPGVLVYPPVIAWRFGRGAEATWRLVLAVGNVGAGPALEALSALIDEVQEALSGAVTAGRPVDLASLDGGAPLPAYEVVFTTRIVERVTR